MRIVTWNCRRSTKEKDIWKHLKELSPDIMLLQEVSSFPNWIENNYIYKYEKSSTKNSTKQRFGNLLAHNGGNIQEIELTTELAWVNKEIKKFKGNLLSYSIKLNSNTLNLISVYSPAWPLNSNLLNQEQISSVKLTQNRELWLADLLWYALKCNITPTEHYIIGGDFNLSTTFDSWGKNPRGNQEYLDRMRDIGLIECLKKYNRRLTPTFKNPRNDKILHQIDHLFVTTKLYAKINNCYIGDENLIFGNKLSDHLPIIADFNITE
jgi:exonuclease III